MHGRAHPLQRVPAKLRTLLERADLSQSELARRIGVSPQAPDTPQYAFDLVEFNDEGRISHISVYYLNFNLG